jgi:PEP-CTERM/exosortase A-associated glycosyltransferase
MGMQPAVVTSSLHQQDDASSADTILDGVRYWRTTIGNSFFGLAILRRWPVLREVGIVRLLRKRIETLLDNESFDLIHAHSPALCGIAAWQASRSRHLPFVYEVRSFWEDADLAQHKSPWKWLRYQLGRNLEIFVVRHAHCVVGIARTVLQDLQTRKVPAEKLYHVPNGVDVARFRPLARDIELANSLGTEGIPTLGFIGTLFPWEGVAWLVRAAAELHGSAPQFKLIIVGDGAEAAEVRKAIQETGSGSYISCLGRVPNDQIERYYSVMDVLVYPRRSVRITEMVTPLKPLEAMALEKAVLGSSVGGIRELVEDEKTGILFEAGNTQDFCEKVSRLLKNPGLRLMLGQQARQKVVEEKDWNAIVRRYESVYDAAIRNSRKNP